MNLKKTRLKDSPLIAGVIIDSVNISTLKRAGREGADLIELRIDTFANRSTRSLTNAVEKLKKLHLPIILTIRSKKEGGKFTITETERLRLFKLLIPSSDYIDIELSSKRLLSKVVGIAQRYKKKVIISFHDFKGTPGDKRLEDIIKQAKKAHADTVKIATRAKDTSDIIRLSRLLQYKENLIILAMGKGKRLERAARGSRVFFPLLGSSVTYGYVTKPTAPGQLSVAELKNLLTILNR
jgi:3-dehydroquinate dehydratase-1